MADQARPDIILRPGIEQQPELPLFADGVQRYVWEGRFGAMLIEVIDGRVFVNGGAVEPARSMLHSG